MNELQLLSLDRIVVEMSGGSLPTRYVMTNRHGILPVSEAADWIREFDECTADVAEREAAAGRNSTVHSDGAVLLVDGKPVMIIGGRFGTADVRHLIQCLKR